MITKRSSRKVKISKDEIVSFKFLKYVPYEDTLQYIILKKIYFKSFEHISRKKSLNLLEFKKIYITILEKEIELNRKKLAKLETHYNKIRNKLLREVENHYNNILELDIVDSIYKFSSIKIDLIEYLKQRYSEIKEEYKKNIININFDEMEYITFKQDFINIQLIQNNKFNLIITLPYKVEEKLINKNCIIGMLLRYCKIFISKELKMNFNELIVYYPLEIKREKYNIYDVYNTFQDLDWIKVLLTIKNKLTITSNDNKNCKYCENSLLCFTNNNEIKEKYNKKNKKEEVTKNSLLQIF